jgi:BMFP domain-containing protein YqiC
VIDIRAAMSMAQEMLEDSVNQIKTNVEENSKEGVDTKMVVEAITAVGTLVGGILVEVASKLPKPECKGSGEGSARETIATELDKIIGRMGLVQEDELAALRKRVVDLEAALKKAEKPAPKSKS